MQLTLLQENLRTAISTVSKAVSTRPSLPILSSTLIQATTTGIEIAATDLFLGMKVRVAGKVTVPGSIAIPARLFVESISSLPAGEVEITQEASTVIIKSKTGTLKLSCFEGSEYPAFPAAAGAAVAVKTSIWEQVSNQVGFAVGSDPSRPLLSALLLEVDENTARVIGTDGFRLAVLDIPELKPILTDKLLIPARAIQEVVKSATAQKSSEVNVAIDLDQKQIWWQVGQLDLFVRLLDGEYPPYRKIMPADFTIQAVWDAEEFTDHLKRALIFSRESNYVVKLQFTDQELTISSRGATAGEYSGTMPISLQAGEGGQIAFNGRYVLDLLQHNSAAQLWFGMNDPLKPAEFRLVGQEAFHYIVMPFRMSE